MLDKSIQDAFAALHNHNELMSLRAQVERLKAEVERLNAFTTRTIIPNEQLQAQVDRLIKAGNAVAWDYADRIEIEAGISASDLMESLPSLINWNAAKEGKQP